VKKLGVELAGNEVSQTLHHYNLKSSLNIPEKGDSTGDQRKGTKRKHGG
jgi:hypothetical protein